MTDRRDELRREWGEATDGRELDSWLLEREVALEARAAQLRAALEAEHEWLEEVGCDCGTDEPETCAYCLGRAAIAATPAESAALWEALIGLADAVAFKGQRTIDEALAKVDAARAAKGWAKS